MQVTFNITPEDGQTSAIEINFSEQLIMPSSPEFLTLSETERGKHYTAFVIAQAAHKALQEDNDAEDAEIVETH